MDVFMGWMIGLVWVQIIHVELQGRSFFPVLPSGWLMAVVPGFLSPSTWWYLDDLPSSKTLQGCPRPPRCDYAPRVLDHRSNVHFEIDRPIIKCRSKRHTNQCSQMEDSRFSARWSQGSNVVILMRAVYSTDLFVGSEHSIEADESHSHAPTKKQKEVEEAKDVIRNPWRSPLTSPFL